MKRLQILALAALLLPGCYALKFETRRKPGGAHYELPANFFLWGLAGSSDVDLDALCPGGARAWRTEASVGNSIATGLTLGIYSPRTIIVDCARSEP